MSGAPGSWPAGWRRAAAALALGVAALAGCETWTEVQLAGGRLDIVERGSATDCSFRFWELTPEGMDPELAVHLRERSLLGAREPAIWLNEATEPRLPPVYGVFVDGSFLLSAPIEYDVVQDCDSYYDSDLDVWVTDCTDWTVYDRGWLDLTDSDAHRLGRTIADAGGTVDLELWGSTIGGADPGERFFYRVPPAVGAFLLDARATCRRLGTGYRPPE